MMNKKIISTLALFALLCSLAFSASASQIKNIIFMIPDGAGMNTFDFANDVKVAGGFDDEKFPYRTEVDTSPLLLKSYMAGTCSTNNYLDALTDSAAAGTALSTGYKTLSGYLCVDYKGRPKANVLEAAQSVGKATGIVSTYEWMHATPAAFGAHVIKRTDYKNIYEQMENQGIDVVLGSGYGAVSDYATIQNAVDRGYTVITSRSDLENVKAGDKLWGNATNNSSPYDINLTADQPTLAQMTAAAITALSGDEDGFFLMVEGSKVDTGAHANDALVTSSEYIAFDAAFKVAVEFAMGRTDTIVIATPDHDTGGMLYHDLLASDPDAAAAAVASVQSGTDPATLSWTTGSHTQQLVGVWTYLPEGVETITGLNAEVGDNDENRNNHVIDNTAFAPYIAELMEVDLAALTDELFVDVTDIGEFDTATEKFTFNRGDKYIYRNQSTYYKDGQEVSLDGKVAVLSSGRMYVPAEMIEALDWEFVNDDAEGIQGEGTAADPYRIDDEQDFLDFTTAVNGGESYSGKYFIQRDDIDMSSVTDYAGVSSDVTFSGVYNGDGYTINVAISSSADASVFGQVDGIVVNVGVTGSVTSTSMATSISRKILSGGVLANSYSTATLSGSSASGLAMSVYGTIENCYFGGTITSGAANAIASIGGTAKNCYYVDSCGATQSTTGVSEVTEEEAKLTLAATLESAKASVAETVGIEEADMPYWRQSSKNSLPELYIPVPVVTDVAVSPAEATVIKGEGVQLTAIVTGEYNPSSKVLWSIESTQNIAEGTYITEDGYLYVDKFETSTGFNVMAKSAVNGAVAGISKITISSDFVIAADETITSGNDVLFLDSLVVNEGVTLTLGRGTYVFDEITVNGSLSVNANANVIVLGENKPEGYVEIKLSDKLSTTNVRYAEVDGEQFEIYEYNNIYGVIATENMLVEITEKASADAVVAEKTEYYFVDAEKATCEKLSLDCFNLNVNALAVRASDPVGLRFKTKFSTDAKVETTSFEIVQYGFVIGLESRLINLSQQLNLNSTSIVMGVAYDVDENVDTVFDSTDDEWDVVTAVLYNIPEKSYGENVVSKTYTKIEIGGETFTVYGEDVVANLYEVAVLTKSFDISQEHQAVVDSIIEKAEDMSPDLGFDVGELYN